ncbi:MAG: hypothetical protein JNK72_11165 [Myxococcales bacterium]|nr:hypothetical protein [Myxococcales bacterium]
MSATFRDQLTRRLVSLRESGIRVRRLAFGAPAEPTLLARIEAEHFGFEMPHAFRAFFEAHNGVSLYFHRVDDTAAEIYDPKVALAVEDTTPFRWNDAMHDGGEHWAGVNAADFGHSPNGGFFFAGVICIPDLATIFDTDWRGIMDWPQGTYLFDAFTPFYQTALVVDRARKCVELQPASDHGADLEDPRVDLAAYLDELTKTAGVERRVNGRWRNTYSAG